MQSNIIELNRLMAANAKYVAGMSIEDKKAAVQTIASTMSVKGLRVTRSNTVEIYIEHPLLRSVKENGKVTVNRPDPYEAARNKLAWLEDLDRGVIPTELLPKARGENVVEMAQSVAAEVTLTSVIAVRLEDRDHNLKDHDRETLRMLSRTVGSVKLADVNKEWAAAWVKKLKQKRKVKGVERYLKPSSIRKQVEALARAIEEYYRVTIPNADLRPTCVLRDLPKEYSEYKKGELGEGEKCEDKAREVRLPAGKEEEIVAIIKGEKLLEPVKKGQGIASKPQPLKLHDRRANLLLFWVLVWTGVRMREAYNLRVGDVNVAACRLDLRAERTKKDKDRPVPVRKWLMAELAAYIKERHGDSPKADALVFPFVRSKIASNGAVVVTDTALVRCKDLLTQRFRKILDAAGLPDFWARDLRHEGISRFVEWKNADGSLVFPRVEVIMKFSGHESKKMFDIYWNMREHDFSNLEDVSFA